MKLEELYLKDITREVNPAVSADDLSDSTVKTEIEEYVFTDDIINALYGVMSAIKDRKLSHDGIWINGYFGSGKTTLYNLLTNKRVGMNTDHTAQIDYSKIEFKVKDKSVCAYLFDTSAEPKHKESIERFCKNANLIFIVVYALDLVKALDEESKEESEEKHENWFSNKYKEYFEKLLCNIPRIAPESKVVIILTKRALITKHNFLTAPFIKVRIDQYIENWKSKFSDQFIVATYDLTLKDTTGEDAIKHKNNLYEIIAKSLENYGIENLPKDPDGFREEIKYVQVEKKPEPKNDCKIF